MLKNVKFFTHYLLRPTLAVLPYAAMGLNVLCEGSGLLNFNCITFFILISRSLISTFGTQSGA